MTDNNNDDVENWSLPELIKSDKDVAREVSLFGRPATWYNKDNKEIEETDVEEQAQPLTIDDIEAIRQSAYDDGFNEGKEAGHKKGLEEGKLEGIATGHQEGLTQGLEEGLVEGAEKIQEQVKNWQSLLQRLHYPLEKLDENAEYQLVRLATSLAEQITRSEIKTNPQIILQALKQAVEALPISEQKLIINLHPEDLNFVQEAYSSEQAIQRGWDLQAEPALKRGDCQIHTQVSSIDYIFDTRIEQVLKAFFKENHQLLPSKNDDSSLLNDLPLEVEEPVVAQESSDGVLEPSIKSHENE